jgi:hypothetical protein
LIKFGLSWDSPFAYEYAVSQPFKVLSGLAPIHFFNGEGVHKFLFNMLY